MSCCNCNLNKTSEEFFCVLLITRLTAAVSLHLLYNMSLLVSFKIFRLNPEMLPLLDNEGGEEITVEADFREYCLNQNQRYA